MYNEQLATAILRTLGSAFPKKMQLNELQTALKDFEELSKEEWLTALDALLKDGLAKGVPLRAGSSNELHAVANLEITTTGRAALLSSPKTREYNRTGMSVEAVQAASEGVATVRPDSRNIFLVHGHNDDVTASVARFLGTLELRPIILHEQPNMGRTVIEKFEAHADVGFAVVLLTPDDMGGLASAEKLNPRARQNVILELGYFIGKLGRPRVCALYVEGVEIPSDIHGVLYVAYDNSNGWQLKLAHEIRAAGIAIDFGQVFGNS